MLKFIGRKWKRRLLRRLFSDPLPEGHPVDRDKFDIVSVGTSAPDKAPPS